jgi:hypothetical protein
MVAMVTDDMVHPGSCLHCSLWVVPSVRNSRVGEAKDLMLGLYYSTMRGVADGGVGPFPIWPGFLEGVVSSECACGVWDPEGTNDNNELEAARFSESGGGGQDAPAPIH